MKILLKDNIVFINIDKVLGIFKEGERRINISYINDNYYLNFINTKLRDKAFEEILECIEEDFYDITLDFRNLKEEIEKEDNKDRWNIEKTFCKKPLLPGLMVRWEWYDTDNR